MMIATFGNNFETRFNIAGSFSAAFTLLHKLTNVQLQYNKVKLIVIVVDSNS